MKYNLRDILAAACLRLSIEDYLQYKADMRALEEEDAKRQVIEEAEALERSEVEPYFNDESSR